MVVGDMKNAMRNVVRSRWTVTVSTVCVLFGLLTVVTGALALFGGELTQAAVGDAVPFVLWFNFMAGFLYVLAGVGLWHSHQWAAPLAMFIAVATVVVLTLFLWHVANGKPYELRTVVAMLARSSLWVFVAVFAYRNLGRVREPAEVA